MELYINIDTGKEFSQIVRGVVLQIHILKGLYVGHLSWVGGSKVGY